MVRLLTKKSYIILLTCIVSIKPMEVPAQLLSPGGQDLSDIRVIRDVDYLAASDYQDNKDRLDIFLPKDGEDVPVILFFHGGALRGGTKLDGEAVAARVVPSGIGVVSANYRLTPKVVYPGHIQDAATALAWVIRNIERYGGDPANIYVSGHSAGGYLAVLLAMDPTHLAVHGQNIHSIRGVIPISAFLYVEETAQDRPKDVWGEDPDEWMRASVTPHIGPGKAPMLLIYADKDEEWRKSQNERFASAMQAAGNSDVATIEVSDRDHLSIITKMNEADDKIKNAVLNFINAR